MAAPSRQENKTMKKRKRKGHEVIDNNFSPSKQRKKHNDGEFTEVEFKFLLKDPNTTFQALEKFVQQTKKYPDETDFDIVAEYARTSGEGRELLQLLETQPGTRRTPSELFHIFTVIELILTRAVGPDTNATLRHLAECLARGVLSNHVSTLYAMLPMRNRSSHIKSVLRLLTAIVMQGSGLCRETLVVFDFHHQAIQPLLNRRDSRDPSDVRTCLVELFVAFLVTGDNSVTKQIVEAKGLLNSLFPGLFIDKASTIQLLLTTLLDKVVKNPVISKTSKVRVFHELGLKDLARLYMWRGPGSWTSEQQDANMDTTMDQFDESSLNESQMQVRELVHSLLMELCCSHTHGINFFDKNYGITNKNQNHLLNSLLQSLEKPYMDRLQSELVAGALDACPDQIHRYLVTLQNPLTPRPSPAWLACVTLVTKIFDSQTKVFKPLTLQDLPLTDKLVAMATNCLVPPKELIHHMVQGIRSKWPIVRDRCIKLLSVIINGILATLQYCNLHGNTRSTNVSVTSSLESFASCFRDSALKMLPGLSVIMQCWTNTLKGVSADEEPLHVDPAILTSLPQVAVGEELQHILEVLCSYQSLQPTAYSQQPPNFSALIHGVNQLCAKDINEEVKVTEEQKSALQKLLLQLLSKCPGSLLQSKQTVDGKSVLNMLLEVGVTSQDTNHTTSSPQHFLIKLLLSTDAFGDCQEELSIWLTSINQDVALEGAELSPEERRGMLCDCLEQVLQKPHSYTEHVLQWQQEAAEIEAARQDSTATVSLGAINIGDILKGPDIELEPFIKCDDRQVQNMAVTTQRLPFTGLMIAAVDILNKRKDKFEGGWSYVLSIAEQLLRIQHDPVSMALMLASQESLTTRLTLSLTALLQTYLPKDVAKKLGLPAKPSLDQLLAADSDLPTVLQVIFLCGPDVMEDHTETQERATQLDPPQTVMAARQILQYISIQAATPTKKSKLAKKSIKVFFKYLHSIVSGLVQRISENDDAKDTGSHGDKALVSKVALASICGLILASAVMKQNFLCADRPHSGLITENLGALVSLMPGNIVKDSPHLTDYSSMFTSSISDTTLASVLEVLPGFYPLLDDNPLIEVLTSLLRFRCVEGSELTQCGQAVVLVMQGLAHYTHVFTKHRLGKVAASALVDMAVRTGKQQLLSMLNTMIAAAPIYSVCVNEASFKHILDCFIEKSLDALNLVCIMTRHNVSARGWTEDWLCHTKHWHKAKHIHKHLALVQAYLSTTITGCVHEAVYSKLYCHLWPCLISSLHDPASHGLNAEEQALSAHILQLLVQHSTDTVLPGEALKELSQQVLASDLGLMSTHLCEVYSSLMTSALVSDVQWLETGIDTLVTWCVRLSDQGKKQDRLDKGGPLIKCLLHVVQAHHEKISIHESLVEMLKKNWSHFTKAGLKYHFECGEMLNLLRLLLPIIYSQPSNDPDDPGSPAPNLHDLYNMVLAHSAFLPTMMEACSALKDSLVELVLTCVELSPKCCDSSHLTVMLGAYGATLSLTDQRLLCVLHHYEKAGCSLSKFKPYLWGPSAAEHHAMIRSRGPSLWRQPSVEDVIDHLDKDILHTSTLLFPLKRMLHVQKDIQPAEDFKSKAECYDPSFFMPLLTQLLGSEYIVSCRKFIDSGLLSYAIAALSSYDSQMRAAAYCILSRLYEHLDGAKFAERELVMYLIDCIRTSSEQQNTKFACVISHFLGSAAKLLLTPEEHLYKVVNKWLLSRPGLDLMNVPHFYALLNSAAFEYDEERRWLLQGLNQGLRDTHDYHLYQRRYAFKLLLAFHNSPLCNTQSQRLVLETLLRAVSVKKAALDLVKYRGILPWITTSLAARPPEQTLVPLFIRILSSLWFTLLDKRDDPKANLDTQAPPTKGKDVKMQPCLPLLFTNQMVLACRTLLLNTSTFGSVETLAKFTKCMSSVLCHADKTNSQYLQEQDSRDAQRPVTSLQEPCELSLLLYHLAVLTQNHKRARHILELITVCGCTVPPASMPTKVKAIEESQDSKLCEDQCSLQMIDMISVLRPQVDRLVKDRTEVFLDLIYWALLNVENSASAKLKNISLFLDWLASTVDKHPSVHSALWGNDEKSQAINTMLLNLYSSVAALKKEDTDSKIISGFDSKWAELVMRCTRNINCVFAHKISGCAESGVRTTKIVSDVEDSNDMLKEEMKSTQAVSITVQSTCLGIAT